MRRSSQDARRDPRVLLCVTGGIAVYKAVEVMRSLQKAGCDVRVCMTAEAERFVAPLTFEALCGHPVADDVFDDRESYIPHIDLAEWADVACVVPATANVVAKLAFGLADDMMSTTLLALPAGTPLLVAPAMNVHMWLNPATQHNVQTLRGRGVRLVMPVSGRLACGDVGQGKLASVDAIAQAVLFSLLSKERGSDLAGRRVLVTAGPTHEAIDPVRYIANESSGKMGFCLAAAAAARGAEVTLVTGPTTLGDPAGVEVVHVTSASQMHDTSVAAFQGADAAVCAAAVADYTPAKPADHKLKKAFEPMDRIDLEPTADILAEISASRGDRMVVGFAAETNDLAKNARAKLERKGCDLIVANLVGGPDSAFGSDTDQVSIVSAVGSDDLPRMPKPQVAHAIWDAVVRMWNQREARR